MAQGSQSQSDYEKLGETKLKFVDVISQAVGFMGPVFGAIFLLYLVVGGNNAGKGAGAATPLAIIVAAIGILALGWIIAQYAKNIHAAGALYDYVTAGSNEQIGFAFGWVYLGGLIVLSIAIPLLVGGLLSDFLKTAYNIGVPYWVFDYIYVVILFCVLYFGIKISTRVQLTLVLISASIVTIFLIYIVIKGGANGNTIAPFKLSSAPSTNGSGHLSNLFFGVLYAILLFVGFESAANLAEETSEPKRNIPRAVLLAIVIVGGYFVLASYAESIGFGVQHADKWAGSAALGGPLIVLAGPSSEGGFGSKWFQDLMNILLIIDVSAVGIGASVAASRLIFSLGRDRRIPGVFASVSKRYGTPTVAILTIIGLSIIEIAWVRLGHGVLTRDIPGVPPNVAQFSEYLPVFSWLAAFGSLCLAVIYAAVSLAAIRGLLGKANPVLLTISIVLAVAITGLAIYSQVYKVPAPSNTVPAAFLIWWGVGILFLIILMATKRFRVSAQGAGALDAHTEQLEQVHPEF